MKHHQTKSTNSTLTVTHGKQPKKLPSFLNNIIISSIINIKIMQAINSGSKVKSDFTEMANISQNPVQ